MISPSISPRSGRPLGRSPSVNMGAELDPFGVVPEHCLLDDLESVKRERGHQARSQWAPFGPHLGRHRRRSRPRSLGGQVPRPFTVPGMLRVLVLDHQLVARPGEHAGAGALVGDADRPAAGRVRGDQVPAVLDGGPVGLLPLARCDRRAGLVRYPAAGAPQPVCPGPERGHVPGLEREGHLGQRAVLSPPHPLGQRRDWPARRGPAPPATGYRARAPLGG